MLKIHDDSHFCLSIMQPPFPLVKIGFKRFFIIIIVNWYAMQNNNKKWVKIPCSNSIANVEIWFSIILMQNRLGQLAQCDHVSLCSCAAF